MPADDGVIAGWHVLEGVMTLGIGRSEKRVREHEHDRAHVGMDVTEHLDDPCFGKRLRFGASFGVSAEVEGSCTRQGEHVVIKVVLVEEVDAAALKHGQNMWLETFVALGDRSLLQ